MPDKPNKIQDNTKKKAAIVKALVAEYYKPERHDRCKRWVYRHIVRKNLPMSERTFWRYLATKDEEANDKNSCKGQLGLFD